MSTASGSSGPPQRPPSGPQQPVPGPSGPPQAAKAPIATYIRVALVTLILVLVVLFVLLNKESVTINFIFFEAIVPLIFVLLGCVAIGALLGVAFSFWWKRRGVKKAKKATGGRS